MIRIQGISFLCICILKLFHKVYIYLRNEKKALVLLRQKVSWTQSWSNTKCHEGMHQLGSCTPLKIKLFILKWFVNYMRFWNTAIFGVCLNLPWHCNLQTCCFKLCSKENKSEHSPGHDRILSYLSSPITSLVDIPSPSGRVCTHVRSCTHMRTWARAHTHTHTPQNIILCRVLRRGPLDPIQDPLPSPTPTPSP